MAGSGARGPRFLMQRSSVLRLVPKGSRPGFLETRARLGLLSCLLLLAFPARGSTPPLAGTSSGIEIEEVEMSSGEFVVVVWATWSPHSDSVPTLLEQLSESWKHRAETIGVLFQEDPRDALADDLEVPHYRDGSGRFSKRWGVKTLPFLLIFRNGELAFGGKLPSRPGPLIRRALEPTAQSSSLRRE